MGEPPSSVTGREREVAQAPGAAAPSSRTAHQPFGPARTAALLVWLAVTALTGVAAVIVCPAQTTTPRFGISVYGLVVVTYLLSQIAFAHLYFLRHGRVQRQRHDDGVTVVVPTYNEEPAVLARTARTALEQDYDGPIHVVVIDDGSRPECVPPPEIGAGTARAGRSVELVRFERNRGKRHAHYVGFERSRGEFVATVDSDTELAPDAINTLVDEMLRRPRLGALTANLRVSNRVCLLARLIDIRYWSAFNQERGAQSLFGVMICCCGALAMYRRDFLLQVRDVYIGQRFLGRPCTYGDDRHLTNLALWHGYEAAFVPDACGLTACPTQVRRWVRQQLRWSKSFCREMLWSVRLMHRRNWYFAYSLVLGAVLPFALLWGLGWGMAHIVAGEWALAARYLLAIVFMAMLRGGYGLYRTGEWAFMLAPLYGLMHLAFVLPVRIVAPFALLDTRWGTR